MKIRTALRSCAAAALAALSVTSVLSCGAQTSQAAQTTAAAVSDTAATEAETTTEIPCPVPADVTFDSQTVNIFICNWDSNNQTSNYNINIEEQTGDNVSDAIYNSNLKTMEALGCTFNYIDNGGSIEINNITKSFNAGDNAYDLIYGVQWKVSPLVPKHMLLNLSDAKYINISDPWWYKSYMDEAQICGKSYLLEGDLSLNTLRRASLMLINTDLLANYGKSIDDVYKTIMDGGWTFDEFAKMDSEVYNDLNGDGVRSKEDMYGFATWTRSDVDHFIIDSGVRATKKADDGTPSLDFNNEKTVSCVEKLNDIFWNNNGTYYVEGIDTQSMLSENRVLFLAMKFSNFETFRDVETNYSMIPMPKLDETVDHYSALVHDDTTSVCVPIGCQKTDLIEAVCAYLAYQGYVNVLPQYYDVTFKIKYQRDSSDQSLEIIDMIHDSVTTDFSYVYNYALDGIVTNLRDLIGVKKSSDFASYYAKSEDKWQKDLDKLVASVNEE